MDEAFPTIGREALWERISSRAAFVLVDALAPISYARSHLPGAISLPHEWLDEWAPRRIPDRQTEVVVYCADVDCESSVQVARRLRALGYRNVLRYQGGKRDWVEAGLPLEGSAA